MSAPRIYRPKLPGDASFDPDRCAADMYNDTRQRFEQCWRSGAYLEDDHWWCGNHRPSTCAKREQRFREKCASKAAERQHNLAVAEARGVVFDAVLAIQDLEALPSSVREAVERLRALEARKP